VRARREVPETFRPMSLAARPAVRSRELGVVSGGLRQTPES
jgi:hypothetical protein